MKIVCGSCGAKYSIADDKVAGKVFKIRCKRCSEVIVVQGDQAAAEGGEVDSIWHVVVNGEQQGPVGPADLASMLSDGTIDWEAFVWTEGFDNWLPLRDVEQLVTEISGGGAGQISDEELTVAQTSTASFAASSSAHEEPTIAQTSTASGGYGAAAAFAGNPQMGADPFAASPAGPASGGYGAGAMGAPAAVRGGGASAPLAGGGAASTGPRVSAAQAMTGARNENSVLFSLKNLQALATTTSTPSLRPAPTTGGSAPGFAAGEGSGLIDIRALASATGAGSQGDRPGAQKDDLLALGGQAGGLGALASPMLAAPAADRDGDNKTLLVASILGGAVLVAGAVIAFAMISRPEPQPVAAVAPVAPVAPVAQVAPVAAAAAAVAPTAADSQADTKAEEKDDDSESNANAPVKRAAKGAASGKSKSSSSGSSSSSSKAADPDPDPITSAPKPKPSGGSASLDELLDNAVGGSGKKAAPSKAAAPASNLPEKPSRDDVLNAMNGVKGDVSACANGAGGTAVVNISVKGSTGRVTAAQVEGQTGAVGSCIARSVRSAKFPKFQTDVFKVKFPFRL